MTELWVKKTIWRRYLIEDEEVNEVALSIDSIKVFAGEYFDVIEDIYDKNEKVEYDEEEVITPIEYNIQKL